MAARLLSKRLPTLRALAGSSSHLGVDGTTTHLRSRPRIFRSYSSQENGNGSSPPPIYSSQENGYGSFPPPPPIKSSLPMNIYLESGLDFLHWFILMDKPDENLTRDEIIELYVSTLAKVVGSEEEARMMIYSVSTKYYFAFGVKTSMEIANKLKDLPGVTRVEPDNYIDMKNKDYGGEPFVEGKAVPYDRKYHEVWETRHARMGKSDSLFDFYLVEEGTRKRYWRDLHLMVRNWQISRQMCRTCLRRKLETNKKRRNNSYIARLYS